MSDLSKEDISATPCPIRSHSPDFLSRSKVLSRSKQFKKPASKPSLPATSFPLIAQSDGEEDRGEDSLDEPTEFVELTGVVQHSLSNLVRAGVKPTIQQVFEEKVREAGKLQGKKESEMRRNGKSMTHTSTEEARDLLRAPPKRRTTVHQNKLDGHKEVERASSSHVPALAAPITAQSQNPNQHPQPSPLEMLPDFGTILQPQVQKLQNRSSLMGGGLRRPQFQSKRRISAFLEANRRKKAGQAARGKESMSASEDVSPEVLAQQDVIKRDSSGSMVEKDDHGGLKAPPKRIPQMAGKPSLYDDLDKPKSKGKENIPPDVYRAAQSSGNIVNWKHPLVPNAQEKRPNTGTLASLPARKASGDKNGMGMKKPASTSLDSINCQKKQKLQEFKQPNIQKPVKKDLQHNISEVLTRKRPSSPLPLLPDLDDKDLYTLPGLCPSRSSTCSNSSWDASSPVPQHGLLRLVKRRKTSTTESNDSMDAAQIAFAKQLAARQQQQQRHSGPKRIIPPIGAQFREIETINPVLPENIVQTQMYESEDTWLAMLESSVTQLINAIFASYEKTQVSTIETHLQLRKEMLKIYSSPPFPLLYKRLQASLAFGALSVPKELVLKSSAVKCWGEDLGLKKQFVELFLESYEVELLGIGLEVVIGRQLFGDGNPSSSSITSKEEGSYVTSMGEKDKIKLVQGFLEKFLVNCEDAFLNPPTKVQGTSRLIGALTGKMQQGREVIEEDWGTVAWGLRKSILRALLLILLLDKTKTQQSNSLGKKCLFKRTSKHRSSVAILHALANLLLPSLGDILRPLSHVGYVPEFTQYPLDDYSYYIENLAIDIRDGVRLNRLVELLLYPNDCYGKEKEAKWPLSKNLKFPAIGRAMRIYNVDIALKALEEAGGNDGKVKAADIVDGFRERTVGLLWGVIARWALELEIGGLIDWCELKNEISRLSKKEGRSLEEEEKEEDERGYIALLKIWAKCIARKKGVIVGNLTTSFADGKVFEAIVEEYGAYFGKKFNTERELPLDKKLKLLGCSSYFANLFSSRTRTFHIPSRDFTISVLSFLCSRLLNWSVRERAANTIQRAFRSYLFAKTTHKRIYLLILAHDCATFVKSKEKVLNAVVLIQRTFRQHLKRKIERLLKVVTGVQCCTRGWIARREAWDKGWAVRKIQKWWREIRERKFRERMQFAIEAVIPLQAAGRALLVRRKIKGYRYAVEIATREWMRLQKGKRAREEYLVMKSQALLIQNWWRSVMLMKEARRNYLETRNSVVDFQAFVRGLLIRKTYQENLSAALVIQRAFRSTWETRIARLRFTEILWAAYTVQTRRRAFVVARVEREKYLQLKAYTIALQRIFRERKEIEKAVIIIQNTWRKCKWVVRMRRVLKEVVIIQSYWRGYSERKRSPPRLKLIRKRLAKGTGKVEETLGIKTEKAIGLLKSPASFSRSLLMLDTTTTYSIESMCTIAGSIQAITSLTGYVENTTKQLQKSSTSVPPRNLILTINLLRRLSMNPKARIALLSLSSSSSSSSSSNVGGMGIEKYIFTSLLLLLENLGKQPPVQADLFITTVSILIDLLVGDEGLCSKVAGQKKWVKIMEEVLRIEKGRENEKRSTGMKGGGNLKVKVEKMEVLLGLVKGKKGTGLCVNV